MSDLSSHPFSQENIAYESGRATPSEKSWDRWCDRVEQLLGHDLDGNDPDFKDGDGYSLDEGYEQWRKGITPQSYVKTVQARTRYQKPE